MLPLLLPAVLATMAILVLVWGESPRNRLRRTTLILILIGFNLWFLHWRLTMTLPPLRWSVWSLWPWWFALSEGLTVISATIMVTAFLRTSDRTPEANRLAPLVDQVAHEDPPAVDLLIPTYNEPWGILERTIRSAVAVDWPNLRVFVCDDTQRTWLREQCAAIPGVTYCDRQNHTGAKAGNINHCLSHHARGDFVAVFDADFAINPSFIRRTIGFLLTDPHLALVQTPQHYGNPDPVQNNLQGGGAWADEQRFFFDIHAAVRDAWNQMFCVGTGFIARRSALDAIGGIPLGSVTEDILTTYLLKQHGWCTRYLNEPLANGLAAESMAEYVGQRSRWALGCLQCLHLPAGPLRSPSMAIQDRLWFLDACLYWLTFLHLPLMLIAPIIFLFTGVPVLTCDLADIGTIFLPRLAVFAVGVWWLSEGRLIPLISDVQRMVGMVMMVPAILQGLFAPFGQRFRVTVKGLRRDRIVIQWAILWPFLLAGSATAAGLMLSVLPSYLVVTWDERYLINFGMALMNIVLCLLCILACVEPPVATDPIAGARIQRLTGSVWKSAKALGQAWWH